MINAEKFLEKFLLRGTFRVMGKECHIRSWLSGRPVWRKEHSPPLTGSKVAQMDDRTPNWKGRVMVVTQFCPNSWLISSIFYFVQQLEQNFMFCINTDWGCDRFLSILKREYPPEFKRYSSISARLADGEPVSLQLDRQQLAVSKTVENHASVISWLTEAHSVLRIQESNWTQLRR